MQKKLVIRNQVIRNQLRRNQVRKKSGKQTQVEEDELVMKGSCCWSDLKISELM